jgi:thioredoxin reductase
MHGFLSRDGLPPAELGAIGRDEVKNYSAVIVTGTVTALVPNGSTGFWVLLAGGQRIPARRLLVTTGLRDELPDIPGLAERWGRTVAHCPYCHGYELGARRLGVLATAPISMHQALLVPDWAAPDSTTFFLNGAFEPDADELAALRARGVAVEREPVARVEDVPSGDGLRVLVRGGRAVDLAGLFIAPRTRLDDPVARALG